MRDTGRLLPGVIIAWAILLFLLSGGAASAADSLPQGPIVLDQAERVRLDERNGRLEATGDVEISWGKQQLYAPRIVFTSSTNELLSTGGAKLVGEGGAVVRGEQIQFNRSTGEAKVIEASGKMEPWYLQAPRISGKVDTSFLMRGGSLTTCNLETPHYSFSGSDFYFYPGDRVTGYNVVFWVGGTPVFYLPWMIVDLKHRLSRWEIHPGYSSKEGATLELNYHYLMPRDEQPFTGTIYTDWRENAGSGRGIDIDYDHEDKKAYFYYFQSRRQPLVINSAGEEIRSDTEDLLWKFRSHIDYQLPRKNWRLHSSVDWLSYNRFNRDFSRQLSDRTQTERWIKSSLVHTTRSSLFRIDARQEEKISESGSGNEFIRDKAFMPRLKYQLFSQPTPLGGVYYSFNSELQREFVRADSEWLRSARAEGSMSKVISPAVGFRQTYRFTYGQNYGEEINAGEKNEETHGYFGFTLRNTYNFARRLGLEANYVLRQRVNDKEEVRLELNGVDRGVEEHGRETEKVDLNLRWKSKKNYLNLDGGYDLRQTKADSIKSDSRILPVRLHGFLRLSDFWNWSQFIRYSPVENEIEQVNTDWQFKINSGFDYGLAWYYNRRAGNDLSKLETSLDWLSPAENWRWRGEVTYNLKTEEYDELKFLVKRQLHCWDMRLMYREILNRDRQFWVMFTLGAYPSRGLGLQQDVSRSSIDFEGGDWREIDD